MTTPGQPRRAGSEAQPQDATTHRDEPVRDPHLEAALRHAPDADLVAPPLVRARIIAAAQRSAEAARQRRPWWRRLGGDWTPWRMGGAGTAAAALLAATVLWVGRDEQPAAPDLRPALPAVADAPGTSDAAERPPAGATVAARPQAPTTQPATQEPTERTPPPASARAPTQGTTPQAPAPRRDAAEQEAAQAAARRAAESSRQVDGSALRMRSEAPSRTSPAGDAPAGGAADARANRELRSVPAPAPAPAPAPGHAPAATSEAAVTTETSRLARTDAGSPSSPPSLDPRATAGAGAARGPAPGTATARAGPASLLDALLAGPDPAAWRVRPSAAESTLSASWWQSLGEATRGRWEALPAASLVPGETWALDHPDGRRLRLHWLPGSVVVCDAALTRCERARLEEATLSRLRAQALR